MAQVNPNTFYYHYTSMDDLALDALNDEKLYEIPSIIRTNFVISDSTILQQHFYNTLEQFWLSLIGVPKENLSEADYLDFTFILHGAISIIKMQTEHYNLDFLKALPNRALGQGIIQTLENLIIKYHS